MESKAADVVFGLVFEKRQPRSYQLIVCENDICTQHRNWRNVDNVMLYVLLRFECLGDKSVLFEENVHYIEYVRSTNTNPCRNFDCYSSEYVHL